MASLDARACSQNADLMSIGKQLRRNSRDLVLDGHVRNIDPSLTPQTFYFGLGSGITGISLPIKIKS